MELLYNIRIMKSDICFPTNYVWPAYSKYGNCRVSSAVEILEPDRHSAVYWLRNTLMIAKEKKTNWCWCGLSSAPLPLLYSCQERYLYLTSPFAIFYLGDVAKSYVLQKGDWKRLSDLLQSRILSVSSSSYLVRRLASLILSSFWNPFL